MNATRLFILGAALIAIVACGRAAVDVPVPMGNPGTTPTPAATPAPAVPASLLLDDSSPIAAAVSSTSWQVTHVNVTVEKVDAHVLTGGSADWLTLVSNPASYDLVALANNATAAMGAGALPAGRYDQVRLLMGTAGTITVNGATSPLGFVPSEALVGWKIVGGFTVSAGTSYTITLDFDTPFNSLHRANGTWVLDPTVKIDSVTGVPNNF